MQIGDMKRMVREAYDRLKTPPFDAAVAREVLMLLVYVVSELVAREDERVRAGR